MLCYIQIVRDEHAASTAVQHERASDIKALTIGALDRQFRVLDKALHMSQTNDLLSAAQLRSAEQALVSTTNAHTSGMVELAKQFGNLSTGTIQVRSEVRD